MQKRTFYGEKEAGPLLRFLNAKVAPGKAKLVLTEFIDWNRAQGTRFSKKALMEAADLGARVMELLATTEFRPDLKPITEVRDGKKHWKWERGWLQFPGARGSAGVRVLDPDHPDIPAEMKGIAGIDLLNPAVFAAMSLADMGVIHQLKQCGRPACRRWFFARKERQLYDGPECSQLVYQSDPKWKAEHAAYMRRRRQKKSRERKEK